MGVVGLRKRLGCYRTVLRNRSGRRSGEAGADRSQNQYRKENGHPSAQ